MYTPKVVRQIERGASKIIEKVGGPHNAVLGLLGIAFLASSVIVEWPYADGSVLKLLDLLPPALLATPTWEVPVKHGLTQMLQTPEGVQELARWLQIDAGVGIIAGALHKVSSRIVEVLASQREERKRLGIEPLEKDEEPSHVFIGPSQLISDFAYEVSQSQDNAESLPIVGVHLDQEIPPVFGQEMTHHFKAGSLNEIIGRHAPTTNRELSFIEAAGIDRAREITIACFNPDNAIFYGAQSGIQIPPNFVSTLIRSIPEEKLKGKKINVILSGESYFGQTTPIEEELIELSKHYGFNLKIIKPEDLVMKKIIKRLEAIAEKKNDSSPLTVVLAGEGKTQADELMLERFKEALSNLTVSNRKINVQLISHNRVGVEFIENLEKRKNKVEELLRKSDLNICYGDTDIGTSTVAELLIRAVKAERDQTLALVERTGMEFDFQRANISYECIYRLVLEAIAKA